MARWGRYRFGLLGFLSIGVGVVAPMLWLVGAFADGPDAPPLLGHLLDLVASSRGVFAAHLIGGGVALLAGPWQLVARWRRWHRRLGYVYAGAVLVGGSAGLVMAPRAWGGPVAEAGFTLLALCWLAATAVGVQRAITGDLAGHRAWMVRSFAMTFAAVTLRLQFPLLRAIGVDDATAYALVAWSSWVPNLAFVAWRELQRAPRPARSVS